MTINFAKFYYSFPKEEEKKIVKKISETRHNMDIKRRIK
jgi:hypothetical protein